MTNPVLLDYAKLELYFQARVEHTDPHTTQASRLFAVPKHVVTKPQRTYAKILDFVTAYNTK